MCLYVSSFAVAIVVVVVAVVVGAKYHDCLSANAILDATAHVAALPVAVVVPAAVAGLRVHGPCHCSTVGARALTPHLPERPQAAHGLVGVLTRPKPLTPLLPNGNLQRPRYKPSKNPI